MNSRLSVALLATVASALSAPRASAQAKADSTRERERASALGAVVVSATRTEQSIKSLPSHVSVVTEQVVATSAAQTVPDLLKRVPGFATRDLQSGMVISPSSSIVSFRGLGGSSAGRTLILLDGLPAGDPFSGWIDWRRIPLPLIGSAEVVRGGGSPVWGSRSLGGVVNLRTITPTRNGGRLQVESGDFGTIHTTGLATLREGKLSAAIAGDVFNTNGFQKVRPDQAGPVDVAQGRWNRAVMGRVTYDANAAWQAWASGSWYDGGVRPLRDDDWEQFTEGRAGVRHVSRGGTLFTAALFANRRNAQQLTLSINSARTTETPQRLNRSPASSAGLTAQITRLVQSRHEISVGADLTHSTGQIFEELNYSSGAYTRSRTIGGMQQIGGLFVQDAADLGHNVRLLASVRGDVVRGRNGGRLERNLPAGTVRQDTSFADATNSHLTYSMGLRWQQTATVGWRASGYEAFRVPSMYELYYPRFSSRGPITEANAALSPERLRGAELGVDITMGSRLLARVTGFTNRVKSPIMDITVGVAGAQPITLAPCGALVANQSCAQRRNTDALRSQGVEAELEWRPATAWMLGTSYAYTPTRVSSAGQPVDGKEAIRAARHMVTNVVSYDAPRWVSVALEGRYVGTRWDNDLNTIQLGDVYLVGLRVNRDLGRGVTAHVKIENLFDRAFEITRTSAGLAERGAPRWITAGLRAAW